MLKHVEFLQMFLETELDPLEVKAAYLNPATVINCLVLQGPILD